MVNFAGGIGAQWRLRDHIMSAPWRLTGQQVIRLLRVHERKRGAALFMAKANLLFDGLRSCPY